MYKFIAMRVMNFAYIETKAALILSNPLQVAARPEISKMTRQTVNPGQNGKLFGGGLYCKLEMISFLEYS